MGRTGSKNKMQEDKGKREERKRTSGSSDNNKIPLPTQT
jgi:hypothetical protein